MASATSGLTFGLKMAPGAVCIYSQEIPCSSLLRPTRNCYLVTDTSCPTILEVLKSHFPREKMFSSQSGQIVNDFVTLISDSARSCGLTAFPDLHPVIPGSLVPRSVVHFPPAGGRYTRASDVMTVLKASTHQPSTHVQSTTAQYTRSLVGIAAADRIGTNSAVLIVCN